MELCLQLQLQTIASPPFRGADGGFELVRRQSVDRFAPTRTRPTETHPLEAPRMLQRMLGKECWGSQTTVPGNRLGSLPGRHHHASDMSCY